MRPGGSYEIGVSRAWLFSRGREKSLSVMTLSPTIVAHRGASNDAPENTQAAIVLAWMQRADAIEGDFRMTKDGHIVCMHDETTGRTTNRNLVVARATLASLKELDAGGWMSPHWRGQQIPTLEEVLAAIPEGKQLFLEIKAGVEMLEPLKQALDQSPTNKDRVTLMAFEPEVLGVARTMFPQFKILLLVNRKRSGPKYPWSPTTREMLDVVEKLNLDGLSCCAAGLLHDHECAPQVLAAGKELHAWTVNRPGNAVALRKMGVSSITTDRPGWLRHSMSSRI